MAIIKGQNLRVLIKGSTGDFQCVAVATSCQFHIAANLEDTSTKDDTGAWSSQEVVSKAWDASVDALVSVVTDTTGKNFDDMAALIGEEVSLQFAVTNGDKNRTASDVMYQGKAILNDLSVTAANKQNSTYTAQFTGVGELAKQA